MAAARFRRRLTIRCGSGTWRAANRCSLSAGHTGLVNAVAITPDGRCAISASADYTLRVWDIESGIYIAAFTGESPMLRCALAPDGRTIIAREKSGRAIVLRLKGLDSGTMKISPLIARTIRSGSPSWDAYYGYCALTSSHCFAGW